MMKHAIQIFLIYTLFACATNIPVTARMYNLENGNTIKIQFENFNEGFGKITGVLPDGKKLSGEYAISNSGAPFPANRMGFAASDNFGQPLGSSPAIPTEADPSWAEAYGFGKQYPAKPVGTGILLDDNGTIYNMVFYSANIWSGYADGVAKSNSGQWYRIHVGNIAKNRQ